MNMMLAFRLLLSSLCKHSLEISDERVVSTRKGLVGSEIVAHLEITAHMQAEGLESTHSPKASIYYKF